MGSHLPVVPIWSNAGVFGVDLFFVLSGFLISNLLFVEFRETGHIKLSRFFFRRMLRLYPSFYVMLASTPLLCSLSSFSFGSKQVLGELTMTQNYVGSIWGHTWTLAIEEHFYLVLPLILAFMMKARKGQANPFRWIPSVFLVLAIFCLAMRMWNATQYLGYNHHVQYEPSHVRFDSLFFGVLLSYLHNFFPQVLRRMMEYPWRTPIAFVGLALFCPAMFLQLTDPFVYTVGFTLFYISFGIMLLLSIHEEPWRKRSKPGPGTKAVAWIGRYSYTIYLWNMPLAVIFVFISHQHPKVNHYLLHVIYFALSIVIGVVSAKLIEIPVLKLRERLCPVKISRAPEDPEVLTKIQSPAYQSLAS